MLFVQGFLHGPERVGTQAAAAMGDILFNYGPGTQYPRVSGASSLFTVNLAYSVWRGAQGEREVEVPVVLGRDRPFRYRLCNSISGIGGIQAGKQRKMEIQFLG